MKRLRKGGQSQFIPDIDAPGWIAAGWVEQETQPTVAPNQPGNETPNETASNISALQSGQDSLAAQIAALQVQLTIANSTISVLQTGHSALTNQGEGLQTEQDSIASQVSALQSQDSGLQSNYAALAAEVVALKSQGTNQQTSHSSIASQVASLQSGQNSLSSQVSALQTQLTALSSGFTWKTYSPTLLGATSNPTVVYGEREGKYLEVGELIIFFFNFVTTSIAKSNLTDAVRISLPVPCTSSRDIEAGVLTIVNSSGGIVGSNGYAKAGTSYLEVTKNALGNALSALTYAPTGLGILSNAITFMASGVYKK